MKNRISLAEAQAALQQSGKEFKLLLEHGTLAVELYHPHEIDKQMPHEQDEVYVIATGESKFFLEGEITQVKAGDFLFVPAGAEHRFLDFTPDFSTWVLFYGPKGGEQSEVKNLTNQ
ncbi:cupin domain-containing protein [Adhaeribacter swui]|uniref:Cupin domain-containing protein n=1 Tax=Adhaeribacter swui TaxID=2086471 RepID=A0A7G7G939_9BACT|nr:cupin domain-containing protein [Adhaeribacter swui]QNF33673.1 cupin domain-containing protein [Adhaeribacter swui]